MPNTAVKNALRDKPFSSQYSLILFALFFPIYSAFPILLSVGFPSFTGRVSPPQPRKILSYHAFAFDFLSVESACSSSSAAS